MAKLTQKDIAKIKYVSMNDYLNNVSKLDNLEDKMKYTTRYLLNHGGYEDYTFVEAIAIAREKIADEMIKSKESNQKANEFIKNPIQYIKEEASLLATEIENQDIVLKSEEDLKSKCISISGYMDYREMENNLNIVNNSKSFNLKVRLANKLGGKREITNTLKSTKPGFFRSLFTRDSEEWKNMNRAFDAFNNPKNELYGNLDALINAAKNYVTHKIPNYKEGNNISDETFNRLDKRSKAKMLFSINILNSAKEQKEVDNNYNEAIKKAQNEKIEIEEHKAIDLEQLEFQNNINKDLSDNNIVIEEESISNERIKGVKEAGGIEEFSKGTNEEEIDVNK